MPLVIISFIIIGIFRSMKKITIINIVLVIIIIIIYHHHSESMLCVTSFSFSIINSTEFDHEHELLENNEENIIQQNNHSLSHTLKLNKIPNTRLRSTSAIEKFSKRNLPLNEFVSVVANATNALLGVSIFAMPWGFAKSGLMGNLIYFLL